MWLVPKEATKTKQGTPAAVFATPTHNHPLPAFLPRPATVLLIFSDHNLGLALHAPTIRIPLPRACLRRRASAMLASVESMVAHAQCALQDGIAAAIM